MQPHERNPDEGEYDETEFQTPAVVQPNWVVRARHIALRHWQPKELTPPAVDPKLPDLGPVERSAEVFRHNLLSLEYWLSPKGWLREWIRFNLRIAVILATPALLVVPLVSLILRQIHEWVNLVVQSTSSFIMFPLSALLLVGLINALIHLTRAISARRQQYRQQQNYYQ